MNWIKVRHEVTGGETEIPEPALTGYRKRGWHPPAEVEAVETVESEPVDTGDNIAEEN